jgi:hypothetical protein
MPCHAYNNVATILKANLVYGEHYKAGTFWVLKVRVQLHRRIKFSGAMATELHTSRPDSGRVEICKN